MTTIMEVHQSLSCNTVGIGRYLDDTVKLDIHVTPSQDRTLVDTFGVVKHDNDLKTTTTKNSPCDVYTTCTSIETTSSCASTPKNVRFMLDKKGRVLCETHKNRVHRTKKEMGACWYTPTEFKQFRRDCKQEAISQQKTSYRENFAAVYAACTQGSFKGVTKERAYISSASCRGLEVVVFPTLHGDRKNAIKTVLKTQAALPETMSATMRDEALASASRFLSKQARQLARVLGSGDAAVSVANNRIAALQNSKGVIPNCFISC
jgi:hypothetical protein